MSRWIWWSMLAAMVVVAIFYFRRPVAVPVQVAAIDRGTIRTYVEELATTRLPQIYKVTMPLAGRILPITLTEGDTVSAGEIVARMDPVDLDTELAEAESQVGQFRQLLVSVRETINAAEEQLVASRAKVDFAEKELTRRTDLFERSAVSESSKNEAELLSIESRVDLTKDTLTVRAIEAVRSAIELGEQNAEEQRRQQARDRQRAEIASPVDGVVLQRIFSDERVLSAGEVLLELGRPGELEIAAEILTQQAVAIEVDDPADIGGPAIGSVPIPGKVTQIYPQGFKKISSLGVEQQRVLVVIQPDEKMLYLLKSTGRTLGIDYRVRVKIYTDQKDDVLKIPRSSLFRGAAGNWQAFIVREGRARLVDLEVGLMNDFEVEVVSQLRPGEPVIVAPESNLADGDRVRMDRADRPSAGRP